MSRGRQPGKIEGADAFPTRTGRAMSWLEPCLGEKRRPRLDRQGPLSQPKGMGSTVELQGKPDEMRAAANVDASTGFGGC